MKLYTETEILSLLKIHLADEEQADSFVALLTPIELPSDEEIENESPYVPKDSHIICFAHQDGFIDGAIWLREKIQGGEL